MVMFDILPGILEKEWDEIEKKLEIYRSFAKGVHIDLIDGKFAPNTTFLDPAPFKKYSRDFLLELHMMVDDPIKYVKPFADAGFGRFIGHVEMMPDQTAFVAHAQLWGEAGLGIDAQTPIEAIKINIEDLDSLLVMTVKTGYSAQGFLEENLEKVRQLVKKTSIPIEIDGGVNDETIKTGCAAGARRFVATSFLFGMGSPKGQYELLKEKVKTFETGF